MAEAVRRRLAELIDARHAAQCDFLAALVRSPSDNPPGDCAAHAERAAGRLEDLGFAVERHAVPEALVREAGMVSVTNLIVRHRFGDGPTIALNAHGDAVPPGDGWSAEPYGAERRDGVMYGRGVAVSKSDFATYAYALRALIDCEAPLGGAVELHFTYDEEAGGRVGPQWLLETGVTRPDYAISAGFSYGVVTHHDGCLHLEVELAGASAHAARPDTGADALEAATAVLAALYRERERYAEMRSRVEGIETPTLVVGLIEGGINTNVVPDRVRLRLDRRMIPEENPDEVEARLRQTIAAAIEAHAGIRHRVRRILRAVPFGPLPGSERLADALVVNARRVFGSPIGCHGVPLYTDARLYAAAGVPTVVYGAGPRSLLEANAHRADERLDLGDLRKATEVVTLALYDLLGAFRQD